MNPIYHDEIQADLAAMGLSPEIVHIDADPSKIQILDGGNK
jgi:hypothetical protein